jgi:chromosome segregation ATPase
LTEELALKSTLLEQAEANAVEAARRAGSELREYVDGQRLKWTSLVKQRDVELVDMQAKLDELLLSRDQQTGEYERELASVRAKLKANESELGAVRLRLAEAEKGSTPLDELVVSHDQQVGRYEKELTDMRAKLEANESELEAVRLRLMDSEKGWTKSKAEADTLRAQTAAGSANSRDEDQVTRRLMERMRALETEVASKRWNEKSIEEMECRNEG